MRKKYITLIAAATVFALDRNVDAVKTARADVTVMSQPDVASRPASTSHGVQDFRESAALVLVGSMLLGLAAAVRRTA